MKQALRVLNQLLEKEISDKKVEIRILKVWPLKKPLCKDADSS